MNSLLKLNFNKGQDLPQGHVHLQPADKSLFEWHTATVDLRLHLLAVCKPEAGTVCPHL